jgi:predicted transcriptional regulator
VGLRVFLLDYALGDPEARGKQKDLASRLNLSEARVSKAIEGLLASLDDLRK